MFNKHKGVKEAQRDICCDEVRLHPHVRPRNCRLHFYEPNFCRHHFRNGSSRRHIRAHWCQQERTGSKNKHDLLKVIINGFIFSKK